MRLRTWRWDGGVKQLSALNTIENYALTRLRGCAQILEFNVAELEQFPLIIKSGM